MELDPRSRLELEILISKLERQLADLQARLPAHSIPPNLIAEMDEIDEQINETKSRLAELVKDANDR